VTTVLVICWAMAVAAWCWRRRPSVPLAPADPTPEVGPPAVSTRGRRRGRSSRRSGVLLASVAVVVEPGLALLIAGYLVLRWWRGVVARRRAVEVLDASLAGVLDLLSVCVSSGQTLALAIETVTDATTGPVREWLGQIRHRVRAGEQLADAMRSASSESGGTLEAVVSSVIAREQIGAPQGNALRHAAARQRQIVIQRRDERIRRLPVLLLLPLTLCVLPAITLVIIVPTFAESIGGFG
jgi:pilus assembly protein TadC